MAGKMAMGRRHGTRAIAERKHLDPPAQERTGQSMGF